MAHLVPSPSITCADAQDSRWCLGGVDAVPIERVLPAGAALLPTSARDWQASLVNLSSCHSLREQHRCSTLCALLPLSHQQVSAHGMYAASRLRWGTTWRLHLVFGGCHLWSRIPGVKRAQGLHPVLWMMQHVALAAPPPKPATFPHGDLAVKLALQAQCCTGQSSGCS